MTKQFTPLPFPPRQYDPVYFSEFIRALNFYFRQLGSPSAEVFDTIKLLNLPTSSTGLPVGSVWRDTTDNTLKIVPDTTKNIVKLVGTSMQTQQNDVGVV